MPNILCGYKQMRLLITICLFMPEMMVAEIYKVAVKLQKLNILKTEIRI